MKNLNKNLFAALIVILFITVLGCQEKEKIELVDVPTTEADSAHWDEMDQQKLETNIPGFNLSFGKGATWRAWEKIQKNCMQSEWLKNPSYYGVSNTIDLGSIITSDNGLQRRLEDAFSAEEIKSIIQFGSFKNCNFKQDFSTNITAILQADVNVDPTVEEGLNAELTMKIQSSKKTTMNIENWRINSITEGRLMDLLVGDDAKKKLFSDNLKNPEYRIITKVIEVQGFTTVLEFESEVSSGLEAKLKDGVIAEFGSGQFHMNMKFINKKTIQMTSKDKVYVFIEKKKGQKIKA